MSDWLKLVGLKLKKLDVKISYPVVFWVFFGFVAYLYKDCPIHREGFCLILLPVTAFILMFSAVTLFTENILLVAISFIVLMNAYRFVKNNYKLRFVLSYIASITTIIFIINLVFSFIYAVSCPNENLAICRYVFNTL